MNVFQMKEQMAVLKASIQADAEYIAEKAGNPEIPLEEINAKKKHRDDTQARYDMLLAECEAKEAQAREGIKKAAQQQSEDADPAIAMKRARGEFYRAVILGEPNKKAFEMLGGIPAGNPDLGYGDRLLPNNLSNELITEPLVENPMRQLVRMSQITGLEEPKLLFDLEGAYDSITDIETAREIEMTGDRVVYGRNKVKVKAKISDTIIHGSPIALASEVDNALRSGLAANEMYRMFAPTPTGDYVNMSFYSTANAVKRVSGANLQKAIGAALADLPIQYRRNAKIVMNAVDWFNMWGDNLNQSGMFFEPRPMTLYGKPVELVDDAIDPVVGDFNYFRINYDIGSVYDTDKDVSAGVYLFVLTAWYDMKPRLSSAFRIATVNP